MLPVSPSLSRTYFIATANSVWRESQGTVQESTLSSISTTVEPILSISCRSLITNCRSNCSADSIADPSVDLIAASIADLIAGLIFSIADSGSVHLLHRNIERDYTRVGVDQGLSRLQRITQGNHQIILDQPLQKLVANGFILVDLGLISQFQKSSTQLI